MASSSFAEIENQNRSLSLPEVRPGTQTAKEKRAGCILPYIDSFKSPVPAGSLPAADCLPQELLLSLKRQRGADPALKGKSLALASRAPSPTAPSTHPPANVWHYPKRWRRLKHLTDHTPCVCGAGRDISFLYDSETAHDDDTEQATASLPATLIPEEYHIVKHPGVHGLEFHTDTHTSQTENHDHHMTIFPSMKPTGRQEVVALKHTMDMLLKEAGIPETIEDSDLCGPSQMHHLLDLVHKEQVIYNICFHEIIRQVTVHCAERGELLANLRQRYNNLIDRIPRQVKSLHDEVMAQRALDKRLTAELKKFKSTISSLAQELASVKEHDFEVTEQSKEVYDNLSTALVESEKNSNLLVEYHNLYELQRKRLETHITNLTAECTLWRETSHSLAHTVAERLSLQSVQRLQLGEEAWSKMATHFAILLTDQDTKQVTDVHSNMRQWRDRVVNMAQRLQDMENAIAEKVAVVEERLTSWNDQFKDTAEDTKVILSRKQMEGLWSDLKSWQDTFTKGLEQFGGEVLHERQQEIKQLRALVQTLTDTAAQLFTRHKCLPDSPSCPEHDTLLVLVTSIETHMHITDIRLSGENGVAAGLIHLMAPLETWDTKLNLALHKDTEKLYLADSDWLKLRAALKDWLGQVKTIRQCVGTSSQETPSPPLEQLVAGMEKWHGSLSHMVDIRDDDNTQQVSQIHNTLVKWTVELLLKMASDSGMGKEEGAPSVSELRVNHVALSDRLTAFTAQLSLSCAGIVRDLVDSRLKEGYTDADEEQKMLKRLQDEASEWVKLADILIGEVAKKKEEEWKEEKSDEDKASIGSKGEVPPVSGDPPEPKPVLPQSMNVLGADGNIHAKSVQKAINETTLPTPASPSQLGLATEEAIPEGRGPNIKDVETLVLSLDHTEKKLLQQQELTKQWEERALKAEKEQVVMKERLAQREAELEQLRTQALAQGTKGKGGKKPTRQTTPPLPRTDKKKS
ncbi:hypothetical protein EMCRGX_G020233 [Ephydatia muelleri]|eukprot:Em0016g165a